MYNKRKLIIRIVAWLLILGMAAAFLIEIAYSEQAIPSTPPQNITVTDIAYANAGGQNWYAEFSWGAPDFPPEATGDRTQIFYFSRVERGTGKMSKDAFEFSMNGTSTSLNTRSYGIELENGTIYEFYGKSQYTYGDSGEYSFTSGNSNRVKFLTDVEFGAELISGTSDIKIVWDDVWDTKGRIDYRILISDTSGFTQPPSIPDIIGSTIGTESSRVNVNGDTLEYVYSNALPGREYSIKVIPLVDSDVSRIPDDEIPVIRVKTEIVLRAKKMGETDDGIRWMLFWDPIVKGSIGSTNFTRVEYKLYRYDAVGVETFFALVTDSDRYEMNLTQEEAEKYRYKIEAIAYRPDGGTVPFYSTALISLEEQIPQFPASPEFVSSFPTADPAPLVFDDLLTDTSATLLWLAPVTGDGELDTEVYYDLYLVDSIDDLSTLPVTKRIGTNLTMGVENEVRDLSTRKIIGYKYKINQLKSNSIYYAVMIAKKNYLTESDEGGFMLSKPYQSDKAIKVIITRPDTETDKPLAPPSPPFRLKPGSVPEMTTFTLQMEKSWLEMYHSGLKKWLYVIREDDTEADDPNRYYNETNSFTYEEYLENKSLPDGDEQKKPERKVQYEAGWEIRIHCLDYAEALKAVKEYRDRDNIIYSDLAESFLLSRQKQLQPISVPDLKEDDPQVITLPVTGMESNKTYLVWVTVMNTEGQLESDPSDPILVTTPPDITTPVEIPVVPTDLKGIASATYVDLYWTFRQNYSYNICFGTEEDRAKASGMVTVAYAQLSAQPWVRISDLDADTQYFFWIQAVSPAEGGGTALSDWSNAVMIKTGKHAPPPRPRGFGIKDTPDAITETSVIYEWLPDETVSYILEISENADFSELTEYRTDDNEYQVTGLKSNYRYFARLYAWSEETGLRSEPTAVIMIITRKGRGEYDADAPLEDIPLGDIVVIDPIATDGVWICRVLGISAYRLSEKIRQPGTGTFSIDLTSPPPNTAIIRVELGGEVIETLTGVKKNLMVKTPGFDYVITPGSLLENTYFKLKQNLGDITVRVDVRTPADELIPEPRRRFVLPVTDLQVSAGIDSYFMSLHEFTRPLRVMLQAENQNPENIVLRFYDSETGRWGELQNNWLPTEGKIAAYPEKSGAIAVTALDVTNQGDIAGSGLEETVRNLLSLYMMPSLPSEALKPDEKLTVSMGMKHFFDVIPYEYGNGDLVRTASRAGLLIPGKITDGNKSLRRDEAIYAAMGVLRKKTGQQISADIRVLDQYEDQEGILPEYAEACAFAAVNGIIEEKGMLYPDRTITRGELLRIIERVLILAGEL